MPSSLRPYSKPVLCCADLIAYLQRKGLAVDDTAFAAKIISTYSYYRIKGYALALRDCRDPVKPFFPGSRFEDIFELMAFDKALRLHALEAIECIELAFRTAFNEWMCAKYATPFWYQDESIFKRGKFRHKEFLCQCERQFEKSKELFTRHYKNNYDTPHLPPGWMLIEITTLGTWSRLYQELADHRDKQEIAARFGLPKVIMESWIHSLSYVRNICAHHGRLWNRVLGVSPKQMRGASPNSLTAEDRFSAVAYMIHHLLMTINNENTWIHDFRTLASGFGDQRHFNMGFKSDWQADPFWGL